MNPNSVANVEEVDGIFRTLTREVWIVTASHRGRRGGLLATWVSPASIDRQQPVLLVGIAPNHFTAPLIDGSQSFAVHLLRRDQYDLAWNFAIGSGRDRDKFAGLAVSERLTQSPLLNDCAAWMECRVAYRLATGDRNYYWGDVVDSSRISREAPMTDRDLLTAANEEQKKLLLANRNDDVSIQRPALEAWRKALPEVLRP